MNFKVCQLPIVAPFRLFIYNEKQYFKPKKPWNYLAYLKFRLTLKTGKK